jgi:hypothetical protein
MGSFLVSVGVELVLPVLAAILTALWKINARRSAAPTAEDWSLSFELLLAAAVLQATFLGETLISIARSDTDHGLLARILGIEIGVLAVLLGVLPLLMANWLRASYVQVGEVVFQRFAGDVVYDELSELPQTAAVVTTLVAGFVLMSTFGFDYYLASLVG